MKCKAAAALVILLALMGLSSSAQAQVDPNLNNATQSYAVRLPEPSTVSNQVRTVLARGYGMCVMYGSRTDVTSYNGAFHSSISGYAEVVADNGWCTGPRINTYLTIETAPIMPDQQSTINYSPRLRGCTAVSGGAGYASAWIFSPHGECAPSISWQYGAAYPQFGFYDQFTVVRVNGATFGHRPGLHYVRPPY